MPTQGSYAVLQVFREESGEAGLFNTFDISEYGHEMGIQFSKDTVEITTFGKKSKEYIPGLKDAKVPFTGPYDQATDILFDSMFNDDEEFIFFQYMPAGADGALYTGNMLVTDYELASDIASPNALSGEFQVSGDVIREIDSIALDGSYNDNEFIDGNILSGASVDGGAA